MLRRSFIAGQARFLRTALRFMACVAVLMGAVALASNFATAPHLKVAVAGCAVLHGGGLCELGPKGKLKILVETDADAQVTVVQLLTELRAEALPVDCGFLLFVSPDPRLSSIFVVVRRGLGWRMQRIPVEQLRAPKWLSEAQMLWEQDQGPRARALLEPRLKEPLSVEERAHALGILAQITKEEDRIDEARQLTEEALKLAREARLVSNELDNVASLARLLNRRYNQIEQAEALWRERQDLLGQMPEMRAWESLHLALYRQKLGDFRAALHYVGVGQVWAQRFADNVAIVEIESLKATLLNQMGRLSESAEAMASVSESKLAACHRADLLAERGWRQILTSTVPSNGSVLLKNDPLPLLENALGLARTLCHQAALEAKLLTYLGHAAALAGDHNAVARRLVEARHLLKHPALELELEWLDLEGKLALAEHRSKDARAHYRGMFERAQGVNAYEAAWRSRIGLAQATELEDEAAALMIYREAEAYLDERSLSMPLGLGRGSYLGRFESGTRFFVDLLSRRGLVGEAMLVVRHARVRGLRALSLTERVNRMDGAMQVRWRTALARYLTVRAELDRCVAAASDAPIERASDLADRRLQLTQQVLQAVEDTLAALGEQLPNDVSSELTPGEALYTCHPVRAGWRCFLASHDGVRSAAIGRLDPYANREELAQQLLLPFSDVLQKTTRLRILTYGEMRLLDMHDLPFGPGKLGDRREVLYALDVPETANSKSLRRTESSDPQRALFLVDANESFPNSRRASTAIAQSLQAEGWQVTLNVGELLKSGLRPEQHIELLSRLRTADWFHYAGHADYATTGGWRHALGAAEETGLLVGDILLLDRVPAVVTLFACNSGLSSEETGGHEGLGMAQAFLLRGTKWALGTVRKVDERLVARVMVEFYRRLGSKKVSPYPALWGAVAAVRSELHLSDALSLRTITPERDLGAFRIFVNQ